MRQRLSSLRNGWFGAALGAACWLVAAPLRAEDPQATGPALPVAGTSQCVEGPGAPPADPSKVTRVVPGKPGETPAAGDAAAADATADVPGAPSPVLLELGAHSGASLRFDDAPYLVTTERAGVVLGGSVAVWPTRSFSLGLHYAHADLSRSETPPLSTDVISTKYEAHTLLGEVRVVPFRFTSGAVFATIGGGLAWQTAKTRLTIPPIDGDPGGSFSCEVGSGAEFAFRAGVGVKARLDRGVSFLADASFLGYRFGSEVLGTCARGAGTAQTLMLRAGFTFDLDITRIAR